MDSLYFRLSNAAFTVVLIALVSAAPESAFAVKVKERKGGLEELAFSKPELWKTQQSASINELALSANPNLINDWNRFLAQNGGHWRMMLDRVTGRPSLVEGGAPWIPGTGWNNTLTAEDLGVSEAMAAENQVPVEMVAKKALELLQAYPGLFNVNPADLRLMEGASGPMLDYLYNLNYEWVYQGVPVEHAQLSFHLNSGNLVMFGSEYISDSIKSLDLRPAIAREVAWQALWNYAGASDADKILEPGRLLIQPVTIAAVADGQAFALGQGMQYRLVYVLAFQREGEEGTWEGRVDAHTGEIVSFKDTDAYGKIQGGVYKTDKNPTQTEVIMPFPYADYGASAWSDIAGAFPGTSGTCTMSGRTGSAGNVGAVRVVDTCGAISLASDGTGLIDFGTSAGADCTTPGFGGAGNTHAARTQYWNVAQFKIKAYTYLSGNAIAAAWLQGVITDNVNVNSTCNANWSGGATGVANFFRSGGGCGNTGEIPGVSLHETGHGLDYNDGNGFSPEGGTGEVYGDVTAILQTHQSCCGGGFFTTYSLSCGNPPSQGSGFMNCEGYGNCCLDCSGIREADYAKHATPTPATPNGFNLVNCPDGYSCEGPCSRECHCENAPGAQAIWDLAVRDLTAAPYNMDLNTAWQYVDKFWYASAPNRTAAFVCGNNNSSAVGNYYNQFRVVDDCDGNLANGTPHAAAIWAAFSRHQIGNSGAVNTDNNCGCASLATPALSGTAGNQQVTLTWPAVTGAASYDIYQNSTSCSSGYTWVGNTTLLSFTHSPLTNGVEYYYAIQAKGTGSCPPSAMSNCVTLTPQPCAASITLDRSLYNCADTVNVSVLDSTPGSSPWTIEAWSSTDGTHKSITLINNPPGSATYTGSFTTTAGAPGAGQVRVSNGDTLTVRFVDPDYCGTPNQNVDTTATVDCAGPVISNVRHQNVTGNSAQVLWDTDENSNSRVVYDTVTPPAANNAQVAAMVTAHAVPLTGLAECTPYYYYVQSTDAAANQATANNGGSYYTFTTGKNTQPTYTSTDVPKTIDGSVTHASTLVLSDSKVIQDLNVNLSNLAHVYVGDLEVRLIGPDSTTVLLVDNRGSTGDNFTNTVFDDEAATSITAGTPPYTGSFRPEAALTAFDGKTANGTWTLQIIDTYPSLDDGTLNAWGLTFTYPAAACGAHAKYNAHAAVADTCSGTGSGGGNSVWEAGETVQFSVAVENDGTDPLTGISVTVTPVTPGVTMVDGTATYANIAVGATGTSLAPHFTAQLPTGLACGSTVQFSVSIATGQGTWSGETFTHGIGTVLPGGGTLFSENFDDVTAPALPTGWAVLDTSGTSGNWATNAGTRYPSGGGTNSSPNVAYFNSYSATDGNATRFYRTSGFAIPVGSTAASLSFYMYHDTGYSTDNDTIQPQISTNGGGAWTNLGPALSRYAATNQWTQHTVDLSAYIGQADARLGFLGTSSFGNDCHIDTVVVTNTAPGGCTMNACTPAADGPPPVNHTGAGAAKFTKGAGNTLNVTYDAATCSAEKLIILHGALNDFTGYNGCAQASGGNGGSTTIDSTGQTSTWYNLVWTSGTTAGHPGFATSGARTWNVGTLCGMTTDDKSKTTCP